MGDSPGKNTGVGCHDLLQGIFQTQRLNSYHKSTILQENKLEQLISGSTKILSNQAERFSFNPIDIGLRKSNYLLIKAKNLSENAFTMFITYGNEKGNNGSLIVRIPNTKDTNDYFLKLGGQYKWFSEENTWIELVPENGNIEIELMEIIKDN